ncbi:hypothetical protein EJ110_NYTH59123 [Nymphaea thermarum]|nr:hypothetical protein EJ110_NYTH59123 [Nymphaea thermarum]
MEKWERARRLLERLPLRIFLMSEMMFTGGLWKTGTMQRTIRVSASSWMRISVDYRRDVNLDRVEDVLLHRKILSDARKPNKRHVIHARFVEGKAELHYEWMGHIAEEVGSCTTQ